MLGIRKYLGTSIDLWQGEVAQFVCDALVQAVDGFGAAAVAPAGSFPAQSLINIGTVKVSGENSSLIKSYLTCLSIAETLGVRHVAVPVFDLISRESDASNSREIAAEAAMKATREFLQILRELSLPVKRITLVAKDGRSYEMLQAALYREYPEDLK